MASALDINMQREMQKGPDPATTLRWRRFGHEIHEEWEAAWALVEQARAAGYPDFGSRSGPMRIWNGMAAETAARAGHWLEAEHLAGEAMTLFEGLVPMGLANSHYAFGLAYAGQGKLNQALSEFEEALGGYETLGHPWDIASTEYEMGLVYAARQGAGDKEKAREHLEKAQVAFAALNAHPGMDKVRAALKKD
jgi:tetratricopeptide (TPR) repeat protein